MRTNLKTFATAVFASVLALCAAGAAAHHSAAQFDFAQHVAIRGIVKEFNVTNPHTWAVVELTDDKRGTRNAEYEGHSASHFYRAGFTRDMVKPGDKIAILIAPRAGTARTAGSSRPSPSMARRSASAGCRRRPGAASRALRRRAPVTRTRLTSDHAAADCAWSRRAALDRS